MRAVKKARIFITENSSHPSALTLSRLILALESEANFPIGDIYTLDFETFKLAIGILKDWRIDRYYAGKGKLFAISLEVAEMQASLQGAAPEAHRSI